MVLVPQEVVSFNIFLVFCFNFQILFDILFDILC